MCLRSLAEAWRLVAIGIALSLPGCARETREVRGPPVAESGPQSPTRADPRDKIYEGSAYHISQGQRLYAWCNCVGCHAHGGGGVGPALMDGDWRYGGSLDQIYASIANGRPNGMPAWRGRIPDVQIWELAAYVRSLSGNVPSAAAGSRADEMANIPPPDLMKPQKPKRIVSGGSGEPAMTPSAGLRADRSRPLQ